jgi:UrcA family protein
MSNSTSNISKIIHGSAFRPVLVWIVCLLGTAALASIVSLLGITPAWSATPGVHSVTVSFRDLDLSSPEGANALYRRIQAAAKQVCGYAGADLLERSIWRGCYRNAIADAVGKVNNPLLTAVHTGRPAAMTAMLAK